MLWSVAEIKAAIMQTAKIEYWIKVSEHDQGSYQTDSYGSTLCTAGFDHSASILARRDQKLSDLKCAKRSDSLGS